MKAGIEKAQQLSGFAHSVPQTPELCCNPVTCHEAADVAEAMGREACMYGPFRAWYAGWLHMLVLAGPWHSYSMYRPVRSNDLSHAVRSDLYGGVTPLTSLVDSKLEYSDSV